MAKIVQPKKVTRLDPFNSGNQLLTWGYKFHLTVRDGAKTSCGLVLDDKKSEEANFADVHPRHLCKMCFRGLEVDL